MTSFTIPLKWSGSIFISSIWSKYYHSLISPGSPNHSVVFVLSWVFWSILSQLMAQLTIIALVLMKCLSRVFVLFERYMSFWNGTNKYFFNLISNIRKVGNLGQINIVSNYEIPQLNTTMKWKIFFEPFLLKFLFLVPNFYIYFL